MIHVLCARETCALRTEGNRKEQPTANRERQRTTNGREKKQFFFGLPSAEGGSRDQLLQARYTPHGYLASIRLYLSITSLLLDNLSSFIRGTRARFP